MKIYILITGERIYDETGKVIEVEQINGVYKDSPSFDQIFTAIDCTWLDEGDVQYIKSGLPCSIGECKYCQVREYNLIG